MPIEKDTTMTKPAENGTPTKQEKHDKSNTKQATKNQNNQSHSNVKNANKMSKWRVDYRVNASQGNFDTNKAFKNFTNAIFNKINAKITIISTKGGKKFDKMEDFPDTPEDYYQFNQGSRREHGSYKYSIIIQASIGEGSNFPEIKRTMMDYLKDPSVNAYLSEHRFEGTEVVSEGFIMFRHPDHCNLEFQRTAMQDAIDEVLESLDPAQLTQDQKDTVKEYLEDENKPLPEFELQKAKIRSYLPKPNNTTETTTEYAETHAVEMRCEPKDGQFFRVVLGIIALKNRYIVGEYVPYRLERENKEEYLLKIGLHNIYIKDAKILSIKWAHLSIMNSMIQPSKLPFMWDDNTVDPDDLTVIRVMVTMPGHQTEESHLHQALFSDVQPLNDGYRWKAITDKHNYEAATNWLTNFFLETYQASEDFEEFKINAPDPRFCEPFRGDTKFDKKHERTYSGKAGLHYTTIGTENLKVVKNTKPTPRLKIVGTFETPMTNPDDAWITVVKKSKKKNTQTNDSPTTQRPSGGILKKPPQPKSPPPTTKQPPKPEKTDNKPKKVSFPDNASVNTEMTSASTQMIQHLEEKIEGMSIEFEDRIDKLERKYLEILEENVKLGTKIGKASEQSEIANKQASKAIQLTKQHWEMNQTSITAMEEKVKSIEATAIQGQERMNKIRVDMMEHQNTTQVLADQTATQWQQLLELRNLTLALTTGLEENTAILGIVAHNTQATRTTAQSNPQNNTTRFQQNNYDTQNTTTANDRQGGNAVNTPEQTQNENNTNIHTTNTLDNPAESTHQESQAAEPNGMEIEDPTHTTNSNPDIINNEDPNNNVRNHHHDDTSEQDINTQPQARNNTDDQNQQDIMIEGDTRIPEENTMPPLPSPTTHPPISRGGKRARRQQAKSKKLLQTLFPTPTNEQDQELVNDEETQLDSKSPAHKKGKREKTDRFTTTTWCTDDDDEDEKSSRSHQDEQSDSKDAYTAHQEPHKSSLEIAMEATNRASIYFQGQPQQISGPKMRMRRVRRVPPPDSDTESQHSSVQMPPPPPIHRLNSTTTTQQNPPPTTNINPTETQHTPDVIELLIDGPDEASLSEMSLNAEDLRSVRSDLSRASFPPCQTTHGDTRSINSTPTQHTQNRVFHHAQATGVTRNTHHRNYRGGRVPSRPPPGPQYRPAPTLHQTPRLQTTQNNNNYTQSASRNPTGNDTNRTSNTSEDHNGSVTPTITPDPTPTITNPYQRTPKPTNGTSTTKSKTQ